MISTRSNLHPTVSDKPGAVQGVLGVSVEYLQDGVVGGGRE